MSSTSQKVAVVIGAGPGLGASAARRFSRASYSIALVSRDIKKLEVIQKSIENEGGIAVSVPADASDESSLRQAFATIKSKLGDNIEVLVYNVSGMARGPVLSLKTQDLTNALKISAVGLLIAAQEVAPNMIKNQKGTILVTGATASLRGSANFGGFAAPKFALRALAQSLARELHPQNVHVAHIIVDGQINTPRQVEMQPEKAIDSFLNSDAIAETYFHIHSQPKSTWTQELDMRPYVEKF